MCELTGEVKRSGQTSRSSEKKRACLEVSRATGGLGLAPQDARIRVCAPSCFKCACAPSGPRSVSSEVVHTVSHVSGVESHGGNRQRVPLERMGARVRCGDVRTQRKGNPKSWGQHRLGCHFQFLQLCLLQPLGFGSPVLEPDLHLGFRQVQRAGELCALGDGKVLLLAKLPLQGEQLGRGEGGSGLPVRLVFSQRTRGRTQPSCKTTKRFN